MTQTGTPRRTTGRDAIEITLCALFTGSAGSGVIGLYDDYFARGGTKDKAAELTERINAHFGTDLPAELLVEHPTVDEYAKLVRVRTPEPVTPCTVLLKDGPLDVPPLFCTHPMPGTVFKYISLANAYRGARRLYGMQCYGLEPHREPDRTIEQMAARYIAEMRVLNPDGPYHLLGYSLGGKIAFEMARQLLAENLPLGMVALADASIGVPPKGFAAEGADGQVRLGKLRIGLELGEEDEQRLREVEPAARVAAIMAMAKAKGTLPADYSAASLNRMLEMYDYTLAAAAAYDPGRLDADVAFYRCSERPGAVDYGWGEHFRLRGEVLVLPGDHEQVFRGDNGPVVAEDLERRISEWEAGCVSGLSHG
ncbi:non-ribosomal peptide synthetase [Amycolatopsis sp. NPDC021455]|uniref:thioesterase domain-containing protein n=1 Tax=Amycolatopsis sp. NPDC021455 TaxID=3154901 RepID=UPI0033F31551